MTGLFEVRYVLNSQFAITAEICVGSQGSEHSMLFKYTQIALKNAFTIVTSNETFIISKIVILTPCVSITSIDSVAKSETSKKKQLIRFPIDSIKTEGNSMV